METPTLEKSNAKALLAEQRKAEKAVAKREAVIDALTVALRPGPRMETALQVAAKKIKGHGSINPDDVAEALAEMIEAGDVVRINSHSLCLADTASNHIPAQNAPALGVKAQSAPSKAVSGGKSPKDAPAPLLDATMATRWRSYRAVRMMQQQERASRRQIEAVLDRVQLTAKFSPSGALMKQHLHDYRFKLAPFFRQALLNHRYAVEEALGEIKKMEEKVEADTKRGTWHRDNWEPIAELYTEFSGMVTRAEAKLTQASETWEPLSQAFNLWQANLSPEEDAQSLLFGSEDTTTTEEPPELEEEVYEPDPEAD